MAALHGSTRNDLALLTAFVGREVATLNHYRDTFQDFRMRILIGPEQQALRFGHFFFNAIYAWYTNSQLISLRALTDTKTKGQLNLGTLLKRIAGSSAGDLQVVPAPGAVQAVIDELTTARSDLHRYVSKCIAHRDSDMHDAPSYVDANTLLERVDAIMGIAWGWVFGADHPRIFVERDSYWVDLLFGIKWLPPTEYSSRLAASRDIRYVTEATRRDFTQTDIWARRPTEEALRELGMSREEFDRYRAGDQKGEAP